MNRVWRERLLALAGCVLCLCAAQARALEPDEILLVYNQNVPEGGKLAEFYHAARRIPAGRILALNLPRTEDIAFPAYEREAVYPVRQYLRKNELTEKVKCIVTFYGVPLRVGARLVTPVEKAEAAGLQAQEKQLLDRIGKAVGELEERAQKSDTRFAPGRGDQLEPLSVREQAAWQCLLQQVAQTTDQKLRLERIKGLVDAMRALHGRAGLLRTMSGPGDEAVPGETSGKTLRELQAEVEKAAGELAQLQDRRFDVEARGRMRTIVAESYGLVELARVVQVQLEYLTEGNTASALDSDLSLLWWDAYRRQGWQPNLLHYQIRRPENAPRAMMVMRLDAPQSGMVRDIILMSLKVESVGLRGRVVLDSRGLYASPSTLKAGSYAWYDQGIRNLGELIRTKTTLRMLHDDSATVLPPGSANDVAIYCGWYSLRNYVPCCQFNPGAVAFHVASSELLSLKHAQERGWVAGLLNDGVAATLGPVGEPYLHAFPAADDFFPLLMTGKLELAEVYWKTTPTAGWMMSMIGDPLYRPYGKSPALRVQDLPVRLKGFFGGATTVPSTEAGR